MERSKHVPVMMTEAIEMMNLRPGMVVVDATLGGGGYTQEIYKQIMPGGTLIACDQDVHAIERFKKHNPEIAKNIHIVHSNYSHIRKILKDHQIDSVDAIVADLGLSSDQIEETDRGFSFTSDAAIDMRMDQSQELSAYNVINNYERDELARVIYIYGDEKFSRRIADVICQSRPVTSGKQLASVIASAIPERMRRKSKTHPATKTFQAIRIAVNDEFEHLKIFLTEGIDVLQKDGKFIVVSFHSGEDRLVKNIFRANARGCICSLDMPVCRCGHSPIVSVITKKILTPSSEEIESNPRARSAKLRAVRKL